MLLMLIIAAVFPQDILLAKAHDERLKFARPVSKLIRLISLRPFVHFVK